jgi:hypothetical protein
MPTIRRAMTYSNLTYYEALELPVDTFLLMVKNSVIEELNSTPEGRKYLEDCRRMEVTKPDLAKLNSVFGIKTKEV